MMATMTVVAMGGLGILTVAFVASVAFRRASASLRHLVWLAALSAALALPLLEGVGVELRLDVPEALALAWAVPGPVEAADAEDDGETGLPEGAIGLAGGAIGLAGGDIGIAWGTGDAAPRDLDGPDDVGGDAEGRAPGLGDAARRTVEPAVESGAASSDDAATVLPPPAAEEAGRGSGSAAFGAARSDPVGPTPGFWAPSLRAVGLWAVGLWAFGALVLLLGTLVGSLQARSLTVRDVTPASPRSLELAESARERLGLHRPVRIVVSGRIDVPATWGVLRPTVLLPQESTRWSDDTLHRVLLHELAHVQRGDCAAYLVGELARAVHWPNPLAWLAVRCLRVESERAADDRVVEVTDLPSAYAGDLVSMLRSLGRRASLPSAALAMARPSGLSVRVRAILDPRQARGRVGRPAATVVASVASILALAATVVTPVADAQETGDAAMSVGPSTPAATAGEQSAPATNPSVQTASEASGPELDPSAPEATARVRSAGASLSMAAPVAAASQERPCAFGEEGERRSMSTHVDDDEMEIRWETDRCRVEIDIEGPVEFSADDRGIVSLAPDGLFEIEERIGRDTRRARIEARSGGGLERRYWDDGDETPWGPEADRWLASLLPQVFRHSTINAEARVRRMLDEGGPERVFDEVEQIHSDHVARTYLQLMMEATELDEDGYRRVLRAAAAIDSDHGSAELMMSVIDRAGLRPSFQDPLLAASERLDSDHQRSRVLRTLLESPLSGSQLDAVLRSASSIDSDHNLAELLSLIARAGRLDDAQRASFLRALGSIESDHQQARVIHTFLDSGTLSDDELAAVLAMSDDIDSDHQRAEVLQRVAREYPLTGAQVTAYLESAARIDSDHQRASTATAIIERADFDTEQLGLVLRIVADIDSDHQMARVLGRVVQRRELSRAEVSQLVSVSRRIDSDHQLSELLSLLVRERPLGDEGLVAVLEVAEGIDSSHQRAELLLRVADRYELEGRARDLYRSLADDLSRRDRERALAAIVR